MNNTYLIHHGILGQKWGVRRYQNPDGSLTAAGKKRYSEISSENLRKELHKNIRGERKKQYGFAGQFLWSNTIGENSRKAIDERRKELDILQKSDETKAYYKKLNAISNKSDSGKIDGEEYDKKWKQAQAEYFQTETGKRMRAAQSVRIGDKWTKEYVNGYGKNITLAYLKDLGFNDEAAEFVRLQLAKDLKVLD